MSVTEEDLTALKQWITSQPHLPKNYDERILEPFLRGCKFSLERTKNKLDGYFTCREVYPELFKERDSTCQQVRTAVAALNVVPLPDLSSDGLKIVLHRYTGADASEFDTVHVFRMIYMIADIRLVSEPPIQGDIFLFDVANMTPTHFTKLVSPIVKFALHCAQDAYPQRLKVIHLFNAPPLIDRVVNFFRPFLKEKMRNRFQIHTTLNTLYEFVPRSHLPSDYGGSLDTIDNLQNEWIDKLCGYKEYFEQQEHVKCDESKRDKAGPTARDTSGFGCDGAFRKLLID